MTVSQDEEAEDRYAKEKMAAVAGAPASGEGGGEAEADSEAIPGAERPGEAAVEAGCVQGHPGSEQVSSPRAEGLRQPQAEKEEGAEASAWPAGHNMDTRDCNMAEPMQLAEGLTIPPGPASLGPTSMEVCDMSSSMLGIPSDAEAPELNMEETGGLSSPKSRSLEPMMEERDDQSLQHNQTSTRATEPISMEGIEVIPSSPTPNPEEPRLSQCSPDQEEPRNPSSSSPMRHTPSPLETSPVMDQPGSCWFRLSPSPEQIRLSPSNPVCVRDGSGLSPSKPNYELEEFVSSPPDAEELAQPNSNLKVLAPSQPNAEALAPSQPNPDLEQLASSETNSDLEELPLSEANPNVEKPALLEAYPDLEELPPSEPNLSVEVPALLETNSDLEELPPLEPNLNVEVPALLEANSDLEELPLSKPNLNVEEPALLEANSDLEELPLSEPNPNVEEPALLAYPDLDNSRPSEPIPDLKKMAPFGCNPDLEELPPAEPNLDLKELTQFECKPDLEEHPPSEPNPNVEEPALLEPNQNLEEQPPSKPILDIKRLSPSEPTPDLKELAPSEPTPDLKELAPSEPTPSLEELAPSELTPSLEELAPSKLTPNLEGLAPSEPTPSLEELAPSEPNLILKELTPSQPHLFLEELAPSETNPDLEELPPSEPNTDLEELPPSEPNTDLEALVPSESTPDLEELPPSEPNLILEKLTPSQPNLGLEDLPPLKANPDLGDLAPSEPHTDLEELARSETNPDLNQLPHSEVNPDVVELVPSKPKPVLEKLAPTEPSSKLQEPDSSQPNLDLQVLAPSEPNPDLEVLAPVESNSELKVPAPPDLEQLTPSEPNPDQEELASSEPNSDLEKPPPSEPNPVLEELSHPEPNLDLEEPILLEPNQHQMELSPAEPNPDLVDLPPSEPNPDLVELPPSEPNPDLMELPPSEPNPDLVELPSSEPNPDLVELPPSEPNPDLVELPPSEPNPDLVELVTPVPNSDLVELPPLEPNPDVEELETSLCCNSGESTLEHRIEGLASTLQDSIPRKALEVTSNHQELRPPSSHCFPLPEQCPPETVLNEAKGICTVEDVDHLSGNLTQQPKAEIQGLQEISPVEEQGMNSSVKDTCSKMVSVVQEVFITQEPFSEVQSKHLEAVLFPKDTCREEELIEEMDVEPAHQVVSLLENSNHHETQHLVPKMDFQASEQLFSVIESEHDVIMKEEACVKHADPGFVFLDSIPSARDNESLVVDSEPNSLHKSRNEIHDLLKAKVEHVPELLPSKLQQELGAVTVEEKVLALSVAEINQEVHPITGQCAELGVEVKLFLQPVLNKCSEGTDSGHLNNAFPLVSQNTAFTPEDPSKELVSKVTVLEAGSIQTFRNDNLEASSETVCSKVSEQGSKFVPSKRRRENSPEYKESTSLPGDKDYDPFYRDFNNERIYIDKRDLNSDNRLRPHQAPMLIPDAPQFKDHHEFHLEEPKPPSVDSGVEMCSDNPDRCEGPLALERRGDPGGNEDLALGSEVRVKLDHIIQDALVVSFRHGDRIFSGVLMDLSKRFGPHGIPVTLHPKREYKSVSEEPIQVQSTSFQEEQKSETTNENGTAPAEVTPVQSNEPCSGHNPWTSKPPPLFHEGAPYPPPLFIRDTYNQSIPQPPPRKIKRLKKKIYREEPTSIMNAIKLRPRQVLCDKCKNVVTDKKEVRKTGPDSFKLEEGKRRRHDSVTTVNKKIKTEHKVNGKSQNESQKRNPVSKIPNIGHGRGKVVKVAPQTSTQKAQLHAKKVLQSKNMDHAKAREVLKMAKEKAQKKQKETSSSKSAHNKVHFTRRLQTTSSGTLPPRLRIKPQRYRNEENDSSLKIGLESLRSNKMGIKPQTRYTATRSAGEAPSEITSPSNGPQEASSDPPNPSVCVPSGEQDEPQALNKRGGKSNITVYMTINQKKADSSSASVCSSDSTDDLKSTHSECSSTENFDFPPGSMHAPSSASSSSSKEEKKLSNSLKLKMFSKNVSKCVTPDGRTICVGDIVWAKIYGFPWWPARILAITVSRKDNGLLARQEARISWFGSPTTSFLALSQLSPFLENFQSRFNKKRKGLYRKAITEAAKAAKQLTPEVRALLTQFET